jgi:amidohydrolase
MSFESAVSQQISASIDLRHRLHQIPELAFREFKTAEAVRAELDRVGIGHIDGVPEAPTATICVIGDVTKPCIALRADIDALPIIEKTELPYASRHEQRMHACGHDGHMATLLGAAAVLKQSAAQLPVCVKLIFQPAEEEGGGAEKLVRAGALDGRIGPAVRAIFGLHGWPGLPVGIVATKPGTILAATDVFKITITGRGCHGAFPHMGMDPIVTASQAIVNLQQIVSREIDPTEPAVVSVGIIHAGTATNIIPDEVVFEGTARTVTAKTRNAVKVAAFRRIEGIAAAGGCTAKIDWHEGYPATVNEPVMADFVGRIAREELGPQRFYLAGAPAMGGEDFAYYLEKVPGCFFFIGVAPPEREAYPSLHNDRYDFTDAAMGVGMRMFLAICRDFPV